MTIQDIIDGKPTICPEDWEDLQKELNILEACMDSAYDHNNTCRWHRLRKIYRQFRLTDVGYTIIRGY